MDARSDAPANLEWSKNRDRYHAFRRRLGETRVQARGGQIYNLPSSILLPMGRNGPAFIVYPNFHVLFEWNKSFVYVTTAAYFGTRLEGAAPYNLSNPGANPFTQPDETIADQTERARAQCR